ncbi:MAG: ATP-grasp domain-containing protein [Bacteroidales bacterium]|jgi:carbamoyl-phosphate synthase large subunit|nr:ATP-grasp domain-containing protein [Bacteroidales bacterium]MDD3700574.1 ATP-grasp domain-containing protein [Bacteroidales bacterium]MDY0368302.1 ATP-grasp domain-containing protein [Bacteroidales bacterium]
MNKPQITIGVTGLNAIDSPGPGVAVIRGLREAASFDCRIIGLSYESLEPGIYMHHIVDKTYQIPYPSSGTEALMSRLAYIHEKERLDVIIPNFDSELYSFIKLESQLRSMGIHMFLPRLDQFEERHKVNLNNFGKKYHIKVPRSKAIFNVNETQQLSKEYNWPLVVKGKYYDAILAYNFDQVRAAYNTISAKWGLPIIIQEFIHGAEYNVTGLGDGQGNTIAAVPMRKQYITVKGKAWGGISIADSDALKLTDHFLQSTQWRGSFELELMKDKNGDYSLLEINPRMPAWIYLAVGAGQNIPEALVRMAMGWPTPAFSDYKAGKMFVRYSWDMIVDIEEFEQISTVGEL